MAKYALANTVAGFLVAFVAIAAVFGAVCGVGHSFEKWAYSEANWSWSSTFWIPDGAVVTQNEASFKEFRNQDCMLEVVVEINKIKETSWGEAMVFVNPKIPNIIEYVGFLDVGGGRKVRLYCRGFPDTPIPSVFQVDQGGSHIEKRAISAHLEPNKPLQVTAMATSGLLAFFGTLLLGIRIGSPLVSVLSGEGWRGCAPP